MSIHVAKRAGSDSMAVNGRPSGSLAPTLPLETVRDGAKRLGQLGLLMAAVTLFFGILDHAVTLEAHVQGTRHVLELGAIGAGLILSLGIWYLCRKEVLEPRQLLDLGLVYEVLAALTVSLSFHATPFAAGSLPRGWSAVAVWILAFPMLVPSTLGKTVLATFAAAAMDPVWLLLHAAVGATLPRGAALVHALAPTFVSACVAIILSRLLYRLRVEAGKAREMGSYRLIERLGRGGMGEVWRAEHRMLARSAAIKLIRPDTTSFGSPVTSREVVRRFEREARATATLRSPHTVQIYDYGTTEDGTFYYVMELLEGYDLETLVEEFGPLPAARAVHLLRPICRSLAEAHQGGLIHRDIKPANIYVCRYGVEYDFVKVLDFGLVKAAQSLGGTDSKLTAANIVAGTPGYMSPEMALGRENIDWRTDIYSFGCVAYWLMTGHQVFESSGSGVETLLEHVKTPPPPPSQRTENPVPPELERIILSCLEKDPANRPQTAEALFETLGVLSGPRWTLEEARRWWLRNPPGQKRKEPPADETVAPVLVEMGSALK
jgi:serine/threonine-protein kinase